MFGTKRNSEVQIPRSKVINEIVCILYYSHLC